VSPLEHRHLPGLNTAVSAIGAGCWTIGGAATNHGVPIGWDNVDPDAAYAGLCRAYELGVILYDTADVYGLGHSERLVGRLLAQVRRDDVVVSSKVGYFAGTARHPYQSAQIRHQLDTTLDNLDTDHLDIYFLHSTDFGENDQYLPGAIALMHEFRQQGLIRAVGIRAPHSFAEEWTTESSTRGAAARRWTHLFHTIRPDVLTARYNLLSSLYGTDETDVFTFARRHGTGMLIKQALGQGRLIKAGQVDVPLSFSRGDHRCTDPLFTPENQRRLHARLAPLRARYGDDLPSLARVALRYALQHAPDAVLLVGFRNAEQIHTNITCLGDPLPPEELTEIRALLHPTASA